LRYKNLKYIKRKRAWTLTILLIVNFIILFIPANIIYHNVRDLIIDELAKNAMNTAASVANLIEQDLAPYLELTEVENYTQGSYDEAYYNEMLSVFQKLKKETKASYIFTEKMISDTKIEYVLDGEDPASEDFSPIGSGDTMGTVELRSFEQGKILATDMIVDPVWGEFLTGFAPIMDSETNRVVGLVGVDFSAEYVQTLINHIKWIISASFLLIILLSTLILYVVLDQKYRAFEVDHLTDLYSKGYSEQQLVRIMERARRTRKTFSLAMIDIDDFKKINDNFGHLTGDFILSSVGKLLKKNLRHADICSRYGGDEFIIILPETKEEEAMRICSRISSIVRAHEFPIAEGGTLHITMSMGLIQWDSVMGIEDLIRRADRGLYYSKNTGKDKISLVDRNTL